MKTDPTKLPRFATDFGQLMLHIYGELCAEREQAPTTEQVAVYRRMDSNVSNVAALVVMGSPEAIDRFQKEHDLT